MKISEALLNIKAIKNPEKSPRIVETVIDEFRSRFPNITSVKCSCREAGSDEGSFFVAVIPPNDLKRLGSDSTGINSDRFIYLELHENGSGELIASHSYYLYSFMQYLFDDLLDQPIDAWKDGRTIEPAFNWHRIAYDYFLTQEGRIQRGLDRTSYIRELARLGFTHIEVNGLAYPMSLETGPEGETYPMFYTYCPALDQFVSSRLNEGLYPKYYLSANLHYLKENARLAHKYGLIPGLLCFEPRSVPERFFERYPMLRGARVDHPFRSFKPRYNMTITHPKVLEHYAEMIRKLVTEVPELGWIDIWTNDSGAGFEHTKSLYVGRNGGAYLIREWKDDAEIARLAGENALRFFRTLRDSGREVNPEFRVITRLESFYGEHDTIWDGLKDGIEAESASLAARGWDMPYTHPRYADSKAINAGTVYQQGFDEAERSLASELKGRNSNAHFYFSVGPHIMFEPLLGIPHPFLTWKRLLTLHENGVYYLSHNGGGYPRELVPFNVNHEVMRRFQFDPEMEIESYINSTAQRWADEHAKQLVKTWKLTEEAILAFPNTSTLYSTLGFTWYRLWVRPFVPNIEAIPHDERRYYQDFMCTTPHNPNNIDLSRDVLFQLTTPEKSRLDTERIDTNLWKPVDKAISILMELSGQVDKPSVIYDQLIRLQALRCWFMTHRNIAAWIANVHGYLAATSNKERKRCRVELREMIESEIANSERLIELLESDIHFMAMTDQGETPLVYGVNLSENILKRIRLMREHIDDEPYIDPDYIMRKAGECC